MRSSRSHRRGYMLLDVTQQRFSLDVAILIQEAYGQDVALLKFTVICRPFLHCVVGEMGEETARVQGEFFAREADVAFAEEE